jgi:RHS repeat-associated protein
MARGQGEGFVVVSPQGVEYTFNYQVERPARPLKKAHIDVADSPMSPVPRTAYMPRLKVFLLVTKVKDRVGNSTTYTYDSGGRLTSISANDGRHISFAYHGDNVDYATAHQRNWNYSYAGGNHASAVGTRLSSVELPDGVSSWTYSSTGSLQAVPESGEPYEHSEPVCPENPGSDGTYTLTATHPSGARGVFAFDMRRHHRVGALDPNDIANNPLLSPAFCINEAPNYQYRLYPPYFDNFTLRSKTIEGAGLSALTWAYDYFTGAPTAACTTSTCESSKFVTVTGPDQSQQQYEFGVLYAHNEGRLLSQSTVANNAVERIVANTYVADASIASQPFDDHVGRSLNPLSDPVSTRNRPLTRVAIEQDGVSFVTDNLQFDNQARPTRVRYYSGLGDRTEEVTYVDNLSLWVLGQIGETRVTTPDGVLRKPQRNTYWSDTALPKDQYRFEVLQRTLTWYGNGTTQAGALLRITDGGGKSTSLSSYHRGIPQTIAFHDASTLTAVVSDHGEITRITDQLLNPTNYRYDPLGRIISITPPDQDSVAWSPTSIAYTRTEGNDFGISGTHWTRTETTGARQKRTVYDALLRPRVDTDGATNGATSQVIVRRFDHENRLTFESYPRAALESNANVTQESGSAAITTGIHTQFDVLGRPLTRTEKAAGTNLVTAYEYLQGFQVRTTDPKQYQTLTQYMAWGEPTYDYPTQIDAPEGVSTAIVRDVFGKPLSMTRSGYSPESGQLSLTRRYLYDAGQRLCRLDEPETGSTVLNYDDAGNLAWKAIGHSTSPANAALCDRDSVLASQRAIHSYDNLNRLLGIDVPGTTNDLSFTYESDGVLKTAARGGVSWTYTYNKRRLLESETLSLDARSFALDWVYNADGALSGIGYPSGLAVSLSPDALGRPTGISGYVSSVSYHPNGALAGYLLGNQIRRSTTLNARQLPSVIADDYGTSRVFRHTYTYDDNGNIQTIVDGKDGKENRNLGYDGLNRLITATAANHYGVETFSYDALDNVRTTAIGDALQTTLHYNAKNQLEEIWANGSLYLSYGYNDRGDVDSRTADGTTRTYTFDRDRRLTQASGAGLNETYRYDAHGHRVKTTRTNQSVRYQVYSRAGQLLHVDDSNSNERIDFLHLGSQLVAERYTPSVGGTEWVRYQHADARGTPSLTTDAGRTEVRRDLLTPYGTPYNDSWKDGPGFTGHAVDAATQLVYMEQRYYDPAMMRFLSADPVEAKPESFSRYWYANNNPYKFVDPDGKEALLLSAQYTVRIMSSENPALQFGTDVVSVLCACDAGYVAPPWSGAVQSIATPIEMAAAGNVLRGINATKVIFQSAQRAYKGSTVMGHSLSKRVNKGAGEPVWGKITGGMHTWNAQAMNHLRQIIRAPGSFRKVINDRGVPFLEKTIADGRGVRLNMDGTFKGFIDKK